MSQNKNHKRTERRNTLFKSSSELNLKISTNLSQAFNEAFTLSNEELPPDDRTHIKRDKSMRRNACFEIYHNCEIIFKYLKVELYNGDKKMYKLGEEVRTVQEVLEVIAKSESKETGDHVDAAALDCYLAFSEEEEERLRRGSTLGSTVGNGILTGNFAPPQLTKPLDNNNPVSAIIGQGKNIKIERRSVFRLDITKAKKAIGIRAKGSSQNFN